MSRVELSYRSELKAPPEKVWRWITSIHGISTELWPLMKMTAPSGVGSITDVEIWSAATDALVVDLGDDLADSADGVFYFSAAASLAYNTPYYVKATVNKGGDSYSMQAGLVRI